MIPDPLEKKVKIPVRIQDGRVEFLYGGRLPEFRGEVIGDLIVPEHLLKDPEKWTVLTQEKTMTMLPPETYLMAELSIIESNLDQRKTEYLRTVVLEHSVPDLVGVFTKRAFAEIRLKSALGIC